MESKALTEGGICEGVNYFITINKFVDKDISKYQASAIILLRTHQEHINFCDGSYLDVMELARGKFMMMRAGGFYYSNPFNQIVKCVQGTIGGRKDSLVFWDAGQDFIAGKDEKMDALLKKNSFEYVLRQIELYRNILTKAEQMASMKPETNPTKSQLKEMKAEIDRIINLFTVPGLASLTGKSRETISNWKARGRISANAAHEICKIEEIKVHGFTREKFRPDVTYWYIQDEQ